MTFTSTHKEAMERAFDAWISTRSDDADGYPDLVAVIRTYVEARGAKIVPTESTVAMDVAGSIHLRSNAADASGCFETMLAAAPDPFKDEMEA